MANTTDKSILTAAGKALLAQLNAEEKPLIIDKMMFANVPNRPEFPQPDDVVPTDDIVHQEQVEQRGRLSADSVIYSTTLTSDVGPFEFNWTGAYCSEYGVLVTIDHHALTPKTADEPGVAGNTLVRSVVLEYKDIAEITNITVDASSWQYNATDRMKKMDSDVAQSIIDQNGKDWFIEDGFLVTPSGSAYNIKAGAGYVSGNRVSMEFDRSVQVPNKPSFIYIDAHREGTPTGEQVILFDFVITAEDKDDYIDSSTGKDIPHFVCKIAEVLADGSVSDLRPEGDSASKSWASSEINSASEQITGGKIWPKDSRLNLKLGEQQTSISGAIDQLRVDTGEKVEILYLWDAISAIVNSVIMDIRANNQAGYDVYTQSDVFEFVPKRIMELRGKNNYPTALTYAFPEGWGAVPYDPENKIDSYNALQKSLDSRNNVYLSAVYFSSKGLLSPDSALFNEYALKIIGSGAGVSGVMFDKSVMRGFSLHQMPLNDEDLGDPEKYRYTGTIERNIHLENFQLESEGWTKQGRGLFLYYTSMLVTRNIVCRGWKKGTDLWCWASTLHSPRNRDCDIGFSYWTGTTTTIISPYSGNCRLGYLIGGDEDTIFGGAGYPPHRPITLTFISPAADAITQDAYYINDTAGTDFISPSNEGSTQSMFNIRKSNGPVSIKTATHASLPLFPMSKYFMKFGPGFNTQVSLEGFRAENIYSDMLFNSDATGNQLNESILRLENFAYYSTAPIGNLKVSYPSKLPIAIATTELSHIVEGNCYIDIPKSLIGYGREIGAVSTFDAIFTISESGTTSKTFVSCEFMFFSGDGKNISQGKISNVISYNFKGDGTEMTVPVMSSVVNGYNDNVRVFFTIPVLNYQGSKIEATLTMTNQQNWPLNWVN
ncbi:phage tail protein [Vibrio parahaemolyticus]|nr:phage tail protein [Vibrio parahaemolyticus]